MPDSGDPWARCSITSMRLTTGTRQMAATCADPMQILDGMSPHVWQGPTAAEDWWKDVSLKVNI